MDRNGQYYVPSVIPDSDLQYFETEPGVSRTAGWGTDPAVLVVDMTHAFTDERPEVTEPTIEATAELLDGARSADVPVIYTVPNQAGTFPKDYRKTVIRRDERTEPSGDHSEWRQTLDEIVSEIEPTDDETVFHKPRASAFFDTHLSNYLHHYGIDTLIVAGMSTSGCVRATVVDGHSSNFRMVVPQECVADRSAVSHEVSLFDMDMKYADVTPVEDVIDKLRAD